MPKNWKTYKLDKVADVIDSLHKTPKYSDSGYPMIRAQEIVGGNLKLEGAALVSQEVFDDFSKNHSSQIGDLVFSRVGAHSGKVSYVSTKIPFCLGQNTVFIIPKKIDNRFLYYILSSPISKEQIEQQAVVSSYKTISLKTIRGLKISLPPLPEQRVIASILSALDNKIENNLAMNKTLEDMAMALYKHWFVDFGPFQEGNFIDSELGPIPEGWEVKRLDDLCEKIYSGGTPKTKVQEYWNGSIPWLSSGETRANLILETEKTITQLGLDKSSSKMAYKYDIVIASAGQGKTRGQTSLLLIDTSVNQSVLCLRANKKKIHPLTLYYDLRFRYNQFRHISDSFSTRGSLTTKLIGEQILLAVPPIEHQIGFHGQLLKSMELQESNLLENISLIQLRDTSLPKLISGEVRVKDAEKLVSAAL
ncbi:MAG TPA: restriction endonuclease subunit S [Pricia antarctica]|uniref:Restriction endonuclease subunit S n=1 Tax=Pricia antarctica TaxID=641691 RepID=A0A831VWZ5_9FLAO|nr:restriction endonuclease subunit S [Pricia antarctica]